MTPKNFTPEFTAYAAAFRRTPEEQIAHDTLEFPGGCMCGFILWVSARLAEMRKAIPAAFIGVHVHDHEAKCAFFATRAKELAS